MISKEITTVHCIENAFSQKATSYRFKFFQILIREFRRKPSTELQEFFFNLCLGSVEVCKK